jgi:hypothetical protein
MIVVYIPLWLDFDALTRKAHGTREFSAISVEHNFSHLIISNSIDKRQVIMTTFTDRMGVCRSTSKFALSGVDRGILYLTKALQFGWKLKTTIF